MEENRDNPKGHLRRSRVTGFPSPADDHLERKLDLNALLVQHPAATFFMRITEDDTELALRRDDVIVVDRSLEPTTGSLVVAIVEGELTATRHAASESIELWGVITSVIHQYHSRTESGSAK